MNKPRIILLRDTREYYLKNRKNLLFKDLKVLLDRVYHLRSKLKSCKEADQLYKAIQKHIDDIERNNQVDMTAIPKIVREDDFFLGPFSFYSGTLFKDVFRELVKKIKISFGNDYWKVGKVLGLQDKEYLKLRKLISEPKKNTEKIEAKTVL